MGSGDQNSSPHACKAGALLTEPSPHSRGLKFYDNKLIRAMAQGDAGEGGLEEGVEWPG